MPDPSIIQRLQKLNLRPSAPSPFSTRCTIPGLNCDACGSIENTEGITVVVGVVESFRLCAVCMAKAIRHQCAACRRYVPTQPVRMQDAYGHGYYEQICDACAADNNMMYERGKCGLANVRANYERVTDLTMTDEMIRRQRENNRKG